MPETEWWRVTKDDNPFNLSERSIIRVNGYMQKTYGHKAPRYRRPVKNKRRPRLDPLQERDWSIIRKGSKPFRWECPECGAIGHGSDTFLRAKKWFLNHWCREHTDTKREQTARIYYYKSLYEQGVEPLNKRECFGKKDDTHNFCINTCIHREDCKNEK